MSEINSAESLMTKNNELLTLEYAISELNKALERTDSFKIQYELIRVPSGNSFRAEKLICNGLARHDFVAFLNLDHSDSFVSQHVKSLINGFKLPYLRFHWDWESQNRRINGDDYSLNLYPNWKILSKAFLDLIKFETWKNFVMIYQNSDGIYFNISHLVSVKSLLYIFVFLI